MIHLIMQRTSEELPGEYEPRSVPKQGNRERAEQGGRESRR